MSEISEKPAATQPRTTTRSRLIWLLFATVVATVAWCCITSQMPATPLTMVRDTMGQLVREPNSATSPAAVNLQAAKVMSKSSFFSTNASSHSSNAAFPCRRVAIINFSDHPLMRHIGALLPDEMGPLNFVERVDYYPANTSPPIGGQAADLWITLDLKDLKTSGMLPRLGIGAEILVTAGSTLGRGTYHLSEQTSPPIVDSNWQGTMEHKSTTTGFSSDKFAPAAKNIVESLAKQLTDHLQALHDRHGPLPTLNDSFYPEYTPTPAICDDWNMQPFLSSHGFMFSNQTYWRVTAAEPVHDTLLDLQRRLKAGGWKTRHLSAATGEPHLSMTRDEERLNVVPLRRGDAWRQVTSPDGAPATEPRTLLVHYVDRLNAAELHAAVDQQLEAGGPLDRLLVLSTKLAGDQGVRFLELLESQHPTSPEAWLALADQYDRTQQEDKARQAVRRAYWLTRFDPSNSGQAEATKKLAKKLKVEEVLTEEASLELLRELGITELQAGESTPVEVGLNQPALFCARDQSGGWHVFNWRIGTTGSKMEGQRYAAAQSHRGPNGNRSWGSGQRFRSGDTQEIRISGLGKVGVEFQVLPNEMFRCLGTIEP